MKLALLTGGGDVPGLNVVIQAIVQGALPHGWSVLGIRRGWQGLVALDVDDAQSVAEHVLPLTEAAVRTIDRSGGTVLHSSRTLPSRVKSSELPPHLRHLAGSDAKQTHDLTPQIRATLAHLGIDALVAIGGDDTLSYAGRLHAEGVPVVGVPKTMDNDVAGTDYCLGFATCVARTVAYLHQLRTSTASHERIGVLEVMGRNSGASALVPSYVAGADRCVVAEVPCVPARLASLLAEDRARNPSRYAMLVVSEGARLHGGQLLERGEADPYGHRKLGGIGTLLGEELKAHCGIDVLVQNLGYLVRSGAPDALDCMVGRQFGAVALELLAKKAHGRMVALRAGVYDHVALEDVAGHKRELDVARYYDAEQYRPRPFSALGMPMFLGGCA